MVIIQESQDVLVITHENKGKLLYDTFGLVLFSLLALLLICCSSSFNLSSNDLTGGWFTALVGIILCSSLILTKEHTTRWTFDKKSSCLVIEYQGLFKHRQFEFSLERIQSVKVIQLSGGSAEIILPDLEPIGISIGEIPTERVGSYARTIQHFLKIAIHNE